MDLNNSSNWHLVKKEEYAITPIWKLAHLVYYEPIFDVLTTVNSPILSVGLSSKTANPRWYRGAWASLFTTMNERSNQLGESKICRLNAYTYLSFPYYEILPFTLRLSFPKYIEDISLELFEFIDQSGRYLSDPVLINMEEILEEVIAGEEITLTNRTTRPSEIDPRLTITRFTETTKYQVYQVGRFYRIDGNQEVGDPYIRTEPYRLIVEFTSTAAVDPNTIKVRVTP